MRGRMSDSCSHCSFSSSPQMQFILCVTSFWEFLSQVYFADIIVNHNTRRMPWQDRHKQHHLVNILYFSNTFFLLSVLTLIVFFMKLRLSSAQLTYGTSLGTSQTNVRNPIHLHFSLSIYAAVLLQAHPQWQLHHTSTINSCWALLTHWSAIWTDPKPTPITWKFCRSLTPPTTPQHALNPQTSQIRSPVTYSSLDLSAAPEI